MSSLTIEADRITGQSDELDFFFELTERLNTIDLA